jgi:hypothetical protein
MTMTYFGSVIALRCADKPAPLGIAAGLFPPPHPAASATTAHKDKVDWILVHMPHTPHTTELDRDHPITVHCIFNAGFTAAYLLMLTDV